MDSRLNPECGKSVAGLAVLILRKASALVFLEFMSIALTAAAHAQEPLQPFPGADSQQNGGLQTQQAPSALAALHGIVRNASSGEPLPRALVSVEGDAATAALTDGDGKFEIPNLPVGPVIVSLRKPGYLDAASSQASEVMDEISPASHNVMLAEDMPDVEFSLVPMGAIQGQIDLSSGDAAEGITLNLVRRVLMDGRAGWAPAGSAKTRSDGTFRFGELAPGVYELYSEPSLDSENMNLPLEAGRGGATHQWGFAAVYYPDARDPSGAARITVTAGTTVQANLTLVREAFQTVTATAVPPQAYAGRNLDYEVQVMDISGRALQYPGRFDPNTKMIEASLPDGSYRLTVTTSPRQSFSADFAERRGSAPISLEPAPMLQGAVDVQVAGQPVTNLRVALTAAPPIQVELNVLSSGGSEQPASLGQFVVTATQAPQSPGQLPDESMVSELASGQLPGPLMGQPVSPGAYWVHTMAAPGGYCESSFTAGGANLAREPLLVGQAGVEAPLELTLRNDCARLTLSLPETPGAMGPGEEKYYSVFAIPDFDSTADPQEITLRPSTGGSMTLNGLTPGNYHVYTLEGNASFEYRNPAVLAALPSQAVTLSPGATTDLVVQVP
ncbi:MAG: carboxypeptidase-like regulatory domain-containing protein [Terracidiphilus sp.]